MDGIIDLAIIGGGINGCGIAADAAMRGLSVLLCEKDDLASKTSSNSSKLIHGGIRYLEYYDFALVKKALNERQRLLSLAPHLIRPLSFVIAQQAQGRPSWLLRSGLFIYDHLSRQNKLPKSIPIHRNKQTHYFSPLFDHFQKGFLYYDCITDDARLTIANALQAKNYGAQIKPRCELISASAASHGWSLQLKASDGVITQVKARAVINAAGPWVSAVNRLLHVADFCNVALVKGSHLVVSKLYEGEHAYLLQLQDKRIVFVIPYFGNSLIGTTDIDFCGNLDAIPINEEEVDYLIKAVSLYFKRELSRDDIITHWSGVRALIAKDNHSPQALSRDYVWHANTHPAPVVSVYGGKITTYRQLATEVVDSLKSVFPYLKKSATADVALPGAYYNDFDFGDYVKHMHQQYGWLDESIRNRMLNNYGTYSEKILNGCNNINDLGEHIAHGLYQKEIEYLIDEEWAETVEDILWRRSKLGLQFSDRDTLQLQRFLAPVGIGY